MITMFSSGFLIKLIKYHPFRFILSLDTQVKSKLMNRDYQYVDYVDFLPILSALDGCVHASISVWISDALLLE